MNNDNVLGFQTPEQIEDQLTELLQRGRVQVVRSINGYASVLY